MAIRKLIESRSPELCNQLENHYLFQATNTRKQKPISQVMLSTDYPAEAFEHKNLLIVPSRRQDYLLINPLTVQLNLKHETFFNKVTTWDDVWEFLAQGQAFKNMSREEYLYTMGRLFGYPQINCQLFAAEISQPTKNLRSDRITIKPTLTVLGAKEVTIMGYTENPDSVLAAQQLFQTWDQLYLNTFTKIA